jgi:hypothetical protein
MNPVTKDFAIGCIWFFTFLSLCLYIPIFKNPEYGFSVSLLIPPLIGTAIFAPFMWLYAKSQHKKRDK